MIIQDGENGLVGMLLFNKEVSTFISKPTYQLFGKLPKVGDSIFSTYAYIISYTTHSLLPTFAFLQFVFCTQRGNHLSTAELKNLVFENSGFKLLFETHNDSGNFNVYTVTEMTGHKMLLSILIGTSSTGGGYYSNHETQSSVGTGVVDEYVSKSGVEIDLGMVKSASCSEAPYYENA